MLVVWAFSLESGGRFTTGRWPANLTQLQSGFVTTFQVAGIDKLVPHQDASLEVTSIEKSIDLASRFILFLHPTYIPLTTGIHSVSWSSPLSR